MTASRPTAPKQYPQSFSQPPEHFTLAREATTHNTSMTSCRLNEFDSSAAPTSSTWRDNNCTAQVTFKPNLHNTCYSRL